MKTFKFSKKTTEKIVNCFNKKSGLFGIIDNIMALLTIQKCWGNKSEINVFRTYIDKNVYAYYEDDNNILKFNSVEEAIKFIFAL